MLSFGAASPLFAQPDPQYAVPLKIDYRISGAYAELRGNHFHAGLDMGTAGVENIDVHAADDGWVSRVKVGPYGYGRALYIDHPDGHTSVYGHLNGFAAKIDSVVRAEQYARQSFSVDLYLDRNRISVRRDEVVAFSGNTGGSGGPHLHFEVRDSKTSEPLNPLRFIPTAPDVTPPTIFGVKAYAVDSNSQIAGASADKYFPAQSISGKSIDVSGRISFGIHCTDYIVKGGRPCGVIEISLFANDSLVFHSRVDHFSFDFNRHVNSHIDFAERLSSKRFVQRSLKSPGNLLPIYSDVHTPLVVPDGKVVNMRYVVRDFAGNSSSISFKVIGRRNASAAPRPLPLGDLVHWQRTWTKDTLGVEVLIPRESLYDDDYVEIARAGSGYRVGRPSVPLQKPFSISLVVPRRLQAFGAQLFVAQVDNGQPSYVGGSLNAAAGTITAQASSFGTFALAVDSVPPAVRIRNKSSNVPLSGLISIGVSDNLSGISDYSVFIDGRWEVFEYDYKNARLKASPAYLRLSRGQHSLHAVVRDACGNVRSFDWAFRVI